MANLLFKPYKTINSEFEEIENLEVVINSEDIYSVNPDFKNASITIIFENESIKTYVFESVDSFFELLFLLEESSIKFYDEFKKTINYLIFYINKKGFRFGFNSDTNILIGYKLDSINGIKESRMVYEDHKDDFYDLILTFKKYIKEQQC